MEKTKPFRKLGAQEALFVELTERSKGAVQLVVFFRACKSIGVEELMEGMEYLHNRHLMLRSRVEKKSYAQWFCDVGFRDIPTEIKSDTSSFDYQAEFNRLGNEILELDKYSYRLTIYTDKHGCVMWVALVVSHAAIDGRSALILIRDLDRFLRGQQKNQFSASIMDKSMVEYISSRQRLKKPQLSVYNNNCKTVKWPVEKAEHASSRSGCSIYRLLPKKLYDHFCLLAKQENVQTTSIYSAIAVLAARSLPSFHPMTELMLPINAQYLCKSQIEQDVVGECTTTITLSLSAKDTSLDLLSLARLIQKKVRLCLRRNSFFEPPVKLDYRLVEIEDLAEYYASKKNYFPSGLCVSNVGDVFGYTGLLEFFDFGLVMTVQTHGAHPIMLVTYALGGEGVFVFGYCEPLISKESALKYVKTYMELITDISNDYAVE
ncbi:hypothetical protein [Microbulbifer sp. PSTR4-B]|uniref:hypothetical protein n=1 Tax=Microbulbifer sp. PSTR4-B TaxID=3243396 RepID=UPI00403A25E7